MEVDDTALYGLLEGMRNTAGIVGPSLAAGLVAVLSPSAGAIAAAIAFGVSAVATRWAGARYAERKRKGQSLTAMARTDENSAADGDSAENGEPLLQAAMGGLAVLWRVRWLRHVEVLAVVHVLFAVGPWMVALPVLLIERGYSVSVYALVLSAFAAGTVLGALVGGGITGRRRGLYSLMLLSLFGVTAVSPVLTDSVLLIAAAFVIGGVGQQAFDVVKMSGLRRDVPERLHGRAFSADFFFSFASLPLGQAIGAVLIRFVSPEQIMLAAGTLVAMTTFVTMLSVDVRRFASPMHPSKSPAWWASGGEAAQEKPSAPVQALTLRTARMEHATMPSEVDLGCSRPRHSCSASSGRSRNHAGVGFGIAAARVINDRVVVIMPGILLP